VRRNVQDLLAPVLGAGNYRLSVTAEVDNDRSAKPTRSTARPQGDDRSDAPGDRPRQLGRGRARLAEQPAGGRGRLGPASDAATARKEATSRQYAYDRSITQIQRSRGRLARMNVVLNSAAAPGGSKTGWSPAELATSTRSCAAAWASTPSAATSSPSRPGLPAVAAPCPGGRSATPLLDGVNWASWALGGLLLFFLVRPLTRASGACCPRPPGLTPLTELERNAPHPRPALPARPGR
jgi:flagellar M-ring protein FliF